jgi:acyl carrier protein
MALPREEIFKKVQTVLVDALSVEEDQVTPTATLSGDLGAESIDYLDIMFQIEKAFSIKIPKGELFPDNSQSLLKDPNFVQNGKVTPQGLAELKRRMPHVDLSRVEKDPDVNKMGELFTVDAIVNYLDGKLNG